jgi:hypothetical protein
MWSTLHLVEFVGTAGAVLRQHQRAGLQAELPRLRVPQYAATKIKPQHYAIIIAPRQRGRPEKCSGGGLSQVYKTRT